MLTYEVHEEESILELQPREPLSQADFEELVPSVDRFLLRKGRIRGVLIEAGQFPGWRDFESFLEHLRFVRDHHRDVSRVAVVSDGRLTTLVPRLIGHFAEPEVKVFPAGERGRALRWLRAGPGG